jgi:hypothetical protein
MDQREKTADTVAGLLREKLGPGYSVEAVTIQSRPSLYQEPTPEEKAEVESDPYIAVYAAALKATKEGSSGCDPCLVSLTAYALNSTMDEGLDHVEHHFMETLTGLYIGGSVKQQLRIEHAARVWRETKKCPDDAPGQLVDAVNQRQRSVNETLQLMVWGSLSRMLTADDEQRNLPEYQLASKLYYALTAKLFPTVSIPVDDVAPTTADTAAPAPAPAPAPVPEQQA